MWVSRPGTLPKQADATITQFRVCSESLGSGDILADGQIRQDFSNFSGERYFRRLIAARPLRHYLLQHPRPLAGRAHRHRDPHRRALGAVDPRMVGDGERDV